MSLPDSTDRPDENEPLAMAGVVHDINQMLAVITGRAGLLLNQAPDADWERHLRAILLASGDAAAMLRRLSPAGGVAVGEGADLRTVAEEAALLFWPQEKSAYNWRNEIEPGLGTTIPAQILREVLANLLLNALAVLPAGGEVTLSAAAGGEGRVRLRVTDNGPGLPPGDPERLFAPGVSGSGETGRGIGLAACRQLLAQAGGRLQADPTGGAGAVFVLDLPRGGAAGAAAAEPLPPVPAMTVLVVDDEAGVRDMLSEVLTAWGCRVLAYRDGHSALAGYEPRSAAVALIDRRLPGLGGLELATRLRGTDPCLAVVMMSGWQQADRAPGPDPAVVDQEVTKPLELSRIQAILLAGHDLNQTRREGVSRD